MKWLYESPNLLYVVLIFVFVYIVLKSLLGTRTPPLVAEVTAFALLRWLMLRNNLSSLDVLRDVLIFLPILTILFFQPKIRRTFLSPSKRALLRQHQQFIEGSYDDIVLAATTLAAKKTGALIVIERGIELREAIKVGVLVDAEISYDLLVAIFTQPSLLHDGAIIVRRHRIAAAGCFTRLTLNPRLHYGARHRAAIGITEDTDAVTVVVSEETGIISFTQDGRIWRGLDATKLRAAIQKAF